MCIRDRYIYICFCWKLNSSQTSLFLCRRNSLLVCSGWWRLLISLARNISLAWNITVAYLGLCSVFSTHFQYFVLILTSCSYFDILPWKRHFSKCNIPKSLYQNGKYINGRSKSFFYTPVILKMFYPIFIKFCWILKLLAHYYRLLFTEFLPYETYLCNNFKSIWLFKKNPNFIYLFIKHLEKVCNIESLYVQTSQRISVLDTQ